MSGILKHTRNRRQILRAGLIAGGATLGWGTSRAVIAGDDDPAGKIAFIKDGDIWEWASSNKPRRLVEDGAAMDPTWEPGGQLILYARDGGSFSDLYFVNPKTGNRRQLTDNESLEVKGSPGYVAGCSWAIDPCWSHESVACFISDANSLYGEMQLWVLLPGDEYAYEAATDGGDQGSIENVSVDKTATFCVYTVLAPGGSGGGVTYISMRDLNNGTTYPLIEGPRGVYDAAISPDSSWIVSTIRDEQDVSDLWIFNRVKETLERLTENEHASSSAWSPDGEWVAYLARRDSGFELKALRIDPDTGERIGKAERLIDADSIDATSGLSWAVK